MRRYFMPQSSSALISDLLHILSLFIRRHVDAAYLDAMLHCYGARVALSLTTPKWRAAASRLAHLMP